MNYLHAKDFYSRCLDQLFIGKTHCQFFSCFLFLQGLNVYSILQHDTLVMSRDAVNKIVERMHTPIKRWGVHDVVCTVCSAPLGILRSPTKITHVCVVFVLRCKYVSKMLSPWMLVVFDLGNFYSWVLVDFKHWHGHFVFGTWLGKLCIGNWRHCSRFYPFVD